ncbi:MAG: hypoxanthine phosphoribosyltransferase [Deltaproteobacteria bacterium]|nr:hypoxanthine phosphoribosyltransferase [Deltaproteobacteria bacterium]
METKHSLSPYLSRPQIQSLVETLAESVSADYAGKVGEGTELLVTVILNGAVFFAADFLRKVKVPVEVDFVRLSSYGAAQESSRSVRILKDLTVSPEGRHILVVDEIIDTGHTLAFLKRRLEAANPRSVKICALLSKPSRREITVPIDYCGTEVENKFLVGYGLDLDGRYRNLDGIYTLNE